MEFDPRSESKDILSSVYYFPRDENISEADYRACIQEGYISSVATVSGAAESFGLEIDEETFERWKRISAAAGMLDDFLDESSDRQQAYTLYCDGLAYFMCVGGMPSVPNWLDSRLENSIRLIGNSVTDMADEQKNKLFWLAGAIGDISLAKAACSDIVEYINILKEEGVCTGLMISESASLHVRSQPGFDSFSSWAVNALEFGTLADSLRDLRKDYRGGLTGVKFSLMNSFRIAIQLKKPYTALAKERRNRSATISSIKASRKFRTKSNKRINQVIK